MIFETDGPQTMVVRLRFRSDLARIPAAVERIMRLLELSSLPGDTLNLELAFREALANAIVHGNGMDPDKWVHVRACCEPGTGLSIVVQDEGQGFDPRSVPDPTRGEARLAPRGRGILMMRAFMDEVTFARGGTEVHLRKGRVQPLPDEDPVTYPMLVGEAA